eukprot:scaffold76938_cov23-Prasinocladus_malaysianus.AAC.1
MAPVPGQTSPVGCKTPPNCGMPGPPADPKHPMSPQVFRRPAVTPDYITNATLFGTLYDRLSMMNKMHVVSTCAKPRPLQSDFSDLHCVFTHSNVCFMNMSANHTPHVCFAWPTEAPMLIQSPIFNVMPSHAFAPIKRVAMKTKHWPWACFHTIQKQAFIFGPS